MVPQNSKIIPRFNPDNRLKQIRLRFWESIRFQPLCYPLSCPKTWEATLRSDDGLLHFC